MGLTGTQGLLVMAAVGLALLIGILAGSSLQEDAYRRGKPLPEAKGEPQRRKTSDVILLAMGLFALAFIAAMIVIFCIKGAVPDTLIQYTLGAGGVEALLLAGIKVSKVIAGDKPGERGEDHEEVP